MQVLGLKHRLLVFLLIAVACMALGPAAAIGALTHPLKTAIGPLPNPAGVAIDGANGNVFVFNGDSVEIFGPEGGLPIGIAVTKIEGFGSNARPDLAVDNSATSPSKGALYVVDRGSESVKKFALNPISEEYELKGILNGTPALGAPLGIAIDAEGNVFVSNRLSPSTDGDIVEFSPTGEETARFPLFAASAGLTQFAASLTFDSAGNLYAESPGGQGIWKFAANNAGEIESDAGQTQLLQGDLYDKDGVLLGSPTGLEVDQATDTLYVAVGKRVAEYSLPCEPVPTLAGDQCTAEREFGFGNLGSTQRVTVSPLNGNIYVADSGRGDVAVFARDLATVPDAFTAATSEVKQTSATLNGFISADGGPPASCEFQYTTRASFEVNEFETASTVPCAPVGPFTGTSKEEVKAEVLGLSAGAAYVFRLRGSNENGSSFGAAFSFSTVGKPKIDASFISLVTLDSATVEGLVNPNGGPAAVLGTTYTVEYVAEKEFEENEYLNATKLPLDGEAIGSGTEDVKVAQQLSGLAAFTTYHFRIVAENEAGEEVGPDRTFTTYLGVPAGLPDGRVYEQVTPVDKNGVAPSGGRSVIQAAARGNGITYSSGGGIPGAEGAQQYPNYLATRASDWSTQGLLPPASSGSSAAVLGWSEDLSQAFDAQAELPTAPASLLIRDSATHALRTIASEGGNSLAAPAFTYVGASADGSVVVFESDTALSAGGAKNSYNTYAWNRESGEVSLIGRLPNGSVPKKGSAAGSNAGSGIGHYHYTQAQHTVSGDGSRVFFNDPNTGQLYLRENPTAAEESCAIATAACTIHVSASKRTAPPLKDEKPATFWGATPDGSRAFFTSPGKLTDDATTGPGDEGNDLYRYGVEGDELIDLTPDAGDPNGAEVQGVLGTSDDGSSVYFAANGKLDSAPSVGDCPKEGGVCNLYLWHEEDGVTFVAQLNAVDKDGLVKDGLNWASRAGGGEKTSRVSADGQTLLFRSVEQLDTYDNQGMAELYRYQAGVSELACVSCSPTNAAPIGDVTLQSLSKVSDTNPSPASILTRNLSADGNRIFFETLDKLVASDTNGDGGCPFLSEVNKGGVRSCQDVYEWEAKGTGSCAGSDQNGGCLYLLSSGTSPEPSYFADADADGENAFFLTLDSLVKQDGDQIVDIYDARVGGGIASQNPLPPIPPCKGEACKGPVPLPPPSESAGSASFVGPGNPKPPRRHKKPHHKKKQQGKKKQQKQQQKQRAIHRKHG